MKPEIKNVNARVPAMLWRAMLVRAVREDRSVQDLVADALRLYLKTPIKTEAK